jgi:hypothetical protein
MDGGKGLWYGPEEGRDLHKRAEPPLPPYFSGAHSELRPPHEEAARVAQELGQSHWKLVCGNFLLGAAGLMLFVCLPFLLLQ